MAIAAEHKDADALAITTIRTLCMDAVEAANSGHPGTPMAMAPVAYTLWQHFLRLDPADPIWPYATGSCCPQATPRRSSIRCCTWPASWR
jgi:transketolase N-terminal domain/subunit